MSEHGLDSALSVEQARRHVLEQIRPMPGVACALDEALDHVLAESVQSVVDAPAFDNSAMDGYAVAWADVENLEDGVTLPVRHTVPAGPAVDVVLGRGEAARIMTGGRVPKGADTIIIRESTREAASEVTVLELPDAGRGANIRRAGSYYAAGGTLLAAGTRLDAGAIGALASVGRTSLIVHRRPRVGVVSTGDELVTVDEVPGPGQIRNSSAHMLAALIRGCGGVPVVLRIARDTVAHCRARFEEALSSADLVLSIGGVSVGDYDVVRDVLSELGAGMGFWRVRIKPGKPLAFGVVEGVPIIGLPGNPVSSFVAFFQFVYPAILRMRGLPEDGRLPRVRAQLTRAVRSPAGRMDFQRGQLLEGDGGWRFRPYPDQSSGNLMSIVNAGGLAIVPEGVSALAAGDEVDVERLPGAAAGMNRTNA